MQLIKNINLNNYPSKISFKDKENNNNYDILNKKIINNEIFEMREKAKQTNHGYNYLGILSIPKVHFFIFVLFMKLSQ